MALSDLLLLLLLIDIVDVVVVAVAVSLAVAVVVVRVVVVAVAIFMHLTHSHFIARDSQLATATYAALIYCCRHDSVSACNTCSAPLPQCLLPAALVGGWRQAVDFRFLLLFSFASC